MEVKSTCKQCAIGFYQPNAGQLSCIKCPHGRTTSSEGSIRVNKCTWWQV